MSGIVTVLNESYRGPKIKYHGPEPSEEEQSESETVSRSGYGYSRSSY